MVPDSPSIAAALECFRDGRVTDAEAVCRQLLALQPEHTGALQLLAAVACRTGRPTLAAEFLGRALERLPDDANLHCRRAEVLSAAGATANALAHLRRAVELDPTLADAWVQLAAVLCDAGEFDQVVVCCRRALELEPSSARAYLVRGTAEWGSGDAPTAIESLRTALRCDPTCVAARLTMADAMLADGQCDAATCEYQLVLQHGGENDRARLGLADAHQRAGRLTDAAACYRDLAERLPDHPQVQFNLGYVLQRLGQLPAAIQCYREAIRLEPDHARAHRNLRVALCELGRFDEALSHARQAVALGDDPADAHIGLAGVQLELGDVDVSCQTLERGLEQMPGDVGLHFNLATTCLLREDFARGWSEYEWRWRLPGAARHPRHRFAAPIWDGSSLADQTLLVHAEQGLGDEIMYASCFPQLIDSADHCIIECEPRLEALWRRSFPSARILPTRLQANVFEALDGVHVDCQIAAGSVPRLLRRSPADFPRHDGYLVADPDRRDAWRRRLAETGPGLKVGISWRGGVDASDRRRRSTMLSQWRNLLSVSGVVFVNVQYGDTSAELDAARRDDGLLIHDWPDADPLGDVDGFAALVAELDLIISVTNATVHLAGALGRPAWALLNPISGWRWFRNQQRSLWYPSVALLRQPVVGEWPALFRRAESMLRRLAATEHTIGGPHAASANFPVSRSI